MAKKEEAELSVSEDLVKKVEELTNLNKELSEQLDAANEKIEQLKKESNTWGIDTQEKAVAHWEEHYKGSMKPGSHAIMVTQDGNVFYDGDRGAGEVHAKEKNLKKFYFGR